MAVPEYLQQYEPLLQQFRRAGVRDSGAQNAYLLRLLMPALVQAMQFQSQVTPMVNRQLLSQIAESPMAAQERFRNMGMGNAAAMAEGARATGLGGQPFDFTAQAMTDANNALRQWMQNRPAMAAGAAAMGQSPLGMLPTLMGALQGSKQMEAMRNSQQGGGLLSGLGGIFGNLAGGWLGGLGGGAIGAGIGSNASSGGMGQSAVGQNPYANWMQQLGQGFRFP